MLNPKVLSLIFAVFFLAGQGLAQYQPVALKSSSGMPFMRVADVREGMRGTARTVFRGDKSEEFGVEILGVLPNWIGPGQDMIVGKLSGANAERTFVFAGMSGSPVYVDGKLVGAISYSFPFAKEPICGITPIEQMISVVEKAPTTKLASSGPKSFSLAELSANVWRPRITPFTSAPLASGMSADSRLIAVAGQTFVPIATPVTFSGIPQKALDMLAPEFAAAGILPVAASGGTSGSATFKKATPTTLLGGDSVVVQLSRGDISLAAAGTVTLRDNDKIYAFGHPFFSLGSTNLPMSESHVITVVPNANNSFKLAVADATVGSLTQDRATAIYGTLGEAPRMLPVKIRLETSRGKIEEVNFESAFDELLTPLILNAGVAGVLSAQERGVGDLTIEFKGQIDVKGQEPIKIDRRFGGAQAGIYAASAAAVPMAALLRANFANTDVTGVTIDLKASDAAKTATIERLSVDRTQVRAGDTINVSVFQRTESGQVVVERVPLKVPADAAPGPLAITVGDGSSVQQNAAITQFVPKTAAEFISTFNRMKRPDRLYLLVTRTSAGAIIGASEMPNLPPSVLATLNNDRSTGGSKPAVQSVIIDTELAHDDYIVSGSQTLSLEVIR